MGTNGEGKSESARTQTPCVTPDGARRGRDEAKENLRTWRPRMDTAHLIELHRAVLADRLETLKASAEAARQGTRVDGDHRPASRGERGAVTAQAALQAGLAARVTDVRNALQQLDALPLSPRTRVGAGALVQVDDDGELRRFAILPGGAGDSMDTPLGPVRVVSPTSPIARALLGLEAGDEAVLRLRGADRELEILAVS
jgi:transcription elongation factor GreA